MTAHWSYNTPLEESPLYCLLQPSRKFIEVITASLLLLLPGLPCCATVLYVGGQTISITPEQPVALSGQMGTRISQKVENPVTATALALESRDGNKVLDQAIMVACDLVAIREGIVEMVRQRIQGRLPDFDVDKLVLSATHTHTAPVTRENSYRLPIDGIMPPKEYVEFLADRVADASVEAWQTRKPGTVGWGLGYAAVALNRRSVYADGQAQMYGATHTDNFRGIEGYEDHGVEVLYFWDEKDRLMGTAINIACPSQEVEGRSAINADFWHPVRESLRKKYGDDLLVLGWTGAAGDQSPHLMFRKQAEERMRKLRGLSRLEDIARRIVIAWEEAYEGARQERNSGVVLVHKVKTIELPLRKITDQEIVAMKAALTSLSKDPHNHTLIRWHQRVIDRHELQRAKTSAPYQMELHALRLGDVAIATNSFELFTDFGIQMKARSPALQTFIIQLAGPGSYIPSERGARGGGYSAIVQSNLVGAEGGQVLTEHTVEILNSLWTDK
ncbi:MAG: hypothetical protein MK171_10625 [Pirellulales bacterium]|nr:hypothetical protein [Pirellulales bacterium]